MRAIPVIALGLALAACAPRARFEPVPPDRYAAAGDTTRFGRLVVALDNAGWQLQLAIPERVTLGIFAVGAEGGVRVLEWRTLEPGLRTIPVRRAGSPFNPTSGIVETSRTPTIRLGYDRLLLLVGEENQFGPGYQVVDTRVGSMSLSYALNDLPLLYRRTADVAWASYLISP